MEPTASHMLSREMRYRDPAGRVKKGQLDIDCYPQTGWARVMELVVITTDDLYASPAAQAPDSYLDQKCGPAAYGVGILAGQPVKNLDEEEMSREDLKLVCMKWIPACIGIAVLLPLPADAYISPYAGKYAPFLYRFYHHPNFYINKNENRLGSAADASGIVCGPGDSHPDGGSVFTQYIFVAYSTAQFNHASSEDMDILLKVAEGAARCASVGAFWCAAFCIPGEILEQDMYCMSNIIRGSDSLVIAVKPPDNPHHLKDSGSSDPLVQWGKRMWTFPEGFLSPSHKDIQVYTVEISQHHPTGAVSTTLEVIAKRDFPHRVWSDAPEARQLMDHYLGTQILSRLEVSVIAFRLPWGLFLFSMFARSNPAFITLVLIFVAVIFASPYLLRVTYGGKFWSSEARLFGFEGYMDADTIEEHIFGYSLKRFSWSAAGSPLSRHITNEYEERIGRHPTEDPQIRRLVEASNNSFGKQKIFTIIDTLTMTLHLIPAVRPPVVALICGKEGGMLRAVLCSYDWKTQTLFRQSVQRMETPSIDYIHRIARVRFGFEREVSMDFPMDQFKIGGEELVYGGTGKSRNNYHGVRGVHEDGTFWCALDI
ncbi:hypothetical protein K440DRAFT_642222 [Wilcoxina mikolae CBS 423.85]|nr:hypothetical protein K440DRAFT_642222 [Wilcoxina mikolae CBS 423.85]